MAKNGNIHPTRIFREADEMAEAWKKYKANLSDEAKKWPKVQYVGKDGERKVDYPPVPYTLEGFKRFCRENYGEAQHYFDNTDSMYNDFCVICSRIREEIRENQITGGLLGFYNTSITQRLNNLVDKQETTIKEQPLFGEDSE